MKCKLYDKNKKVRGTLHISEGNLRGLSFGSKSDMGNRLIKDFEKFLEYNHRNILDFQSKFFFFQSLKYKLSYMQLLAVINYLAVNSIL